MDEPLAPWLANIDPSKVEQERFAVFGDVRDEKPGSRTDNRRREYWHHQNRMEAAARSQTAHRREREASAARGAFRRRAATQSAEHTAMAQHMKGQI